jgi:molybdate transport system substrate-binding protein
MRIPFVDLRTRVGVLLCGLLISCVPETVPEEVVRVAVAANVQDAHGELARAFEARSGRRVVVSTGSSGQLYAQIRHGAPYDVFLAADDERPRLLEDEGRTVAGTRFTYAVGRLVLFGPGLDSVRSGGADLHGELRHLAIAHPRTAPYGAAAEEVLVGLGVAERLAPRLVRGENIGQTFQFVKTGAAELGFVALSQVRGEPPHTYWLVPADRHRPLLQDAVLLEDRAAAREYLAFLRSAEAARLLEGWGYSVPGRVTP